MGGDYAPNEIVLGVIQSLSELPGDTRLVLFGDEVAIRDIFSVKVRISMPLTSFILPR